MKRFLITCLITMAVGLASAQSRVEKDSLVNVICSKLTELGDKIDSLSATNILVVYTYTFINDYTTDREAANEIGIYIYSHLQKNCLTFYDYAIKKSPANPEWQFTAAKPKSLLSKKECRGFTKRTDYYYLQMPKDTVNLATSNGLWIDSFQDGTTSKLKLKWVSDSDFELTFLESNNILRRNLSTPGEVYQYRVIDKNDSYYLICAEAVRNSRYAIFKAHFK
jgi:hypothetical protein